MTRKIYAIDESGSSNYLSTVEKFKKWKHYNGPELTNNQKYLCLAMGISNKDSIVQFSAEWHSLLEKYKIESFHSTDLFSKNILKLKDLHSFIIEAIDILKKHQIKFITTYNDVFRLIDLYYTYESARHAEDPYVWNLRALINKIQGKDFELYLEKRGKLEDNFVKEKLDQFISNRNLFPLMKNFAFLNKQASGENKSLLDATDLFCYLTNHRHSSTLKTKLEKIGFFNDNPKYKTYSDFLIDLKSLYLDYGSDIVFANLRYY